MEMTWKEKIINGFALVVSVFIGVSKKRLKG